MDQSYTLPPAKSHPFGYHGTCTPISSPPHLSIETKTEGGGEGRGESKREKKNPVWSNVSFVKFNLRAPLPILAPWDCSDDVGGGERGRETRFRSEFQGFYYCTITVCYIKKRKKKRRRNVFWSTACFSLFPTPPPLFSFPPHPLQKNVANKIVGVFLFLIILFYLGSVVMVSGNIFINSPFGFFQSLIFFPHVLRWFLVSPGVLL